MTVRIPDHWIGVKKYWPLICTSLGDALVSLPPERLTTHALLIGATGSGKTTTIHHLLAQDLMNGHSIVVLDARGDLALTTLELCARAEIQPERIKFFDLRERTRPVGFNPLKGSGENYFKALGVLAAIEKEWDSLGPLTADALRNALMLLTDAGEAITSLESVFFDPAFRAKALSRVHSESVKEYWERYDELSDEKQQTFASPVLNKVSLLFTPESLYKMYSHPDPVDLGRHLNTKGSVTLISLAVDQLHGAGWMAGSIFLSSISREIFSRVEMSESSRIPVRFYVDEFSHFQMSEFEAILAEGRRFKCSLLLANQTLAQLTPKLRSMILGNVGVKLIFRTAQADAEILNRDLTGNTKAFDLPRLGVGEAVLWQRGEEPIEIEGNSPLVSDVGSLTPAASSLRQRLYELTSPYPVLVEAKPEADVKVQESRASLEDWL